MSGDGIHPGKVLPRKVLLVAPVVTHPGATGAGARVRDMASALRGLGHDVHFLYLQQPLFLDHAPMRKFWADRLHVFRALSPASCVARARRKLIRLGAKTFGWNVPVDSYFDPGCANALEGLLAATEFEAVIVSYVFYSKLFAFIPAGVRRILDTHDVFADRYQLYQAHGQRAEFFSTSRAEEAKALGRADVVLAIQAGDAAHFRSLVEQPVVVVGHLAPPALVAASAPPAGAGVLFVGGPMAINVHGVHWLLREVWPKVRRERPDAELWLAGGVSQHVAETPGVRRLGFVDDLAGLYSRASVIVNPQQFGTGLSIKCVEALASGRPLVTTVSGARGLEDGAGTAFLAARSPEEFTECVLRLLRDRDHATALAREAAQFAQEYHRRNLRALANVVDGSAEL
ncbi:MAG TPA: glycosyltransferase family 4 protein [Gemmatimonadales bacterium]|nr:glycosyltransferase family 4 protein [Gemmatimonadales bacterium]